LYETIGEILERLLRMTLARWSEVNHLATRLTQLYGAVAMV